MKSRKIGQPSEPAAVDQPISLPLSERNLSISETAKWAGISDPTAWREIAAGKLEAVRIRGRTLTTPAGRARWMETWKKVGSAA